MRPLLKVVLVLSLLAPATGLAADAAVAPPAKAAATAPAVAPAAPQPAPAAAASPDTKTPEKAAEAPTGETQKWWQGALVIVIEGVVAVVTPILSVLLMFLIKKWNLKIEQEKVDWALDKGIGFAEQKAKQALKDGKPMDSPGIKTVAVEKSRELLQKYSLAKKFGDWLADGIEARLGQKVVEAGGANKVVNGAEAKPAESDG